MPYGFQDMTTSRAHVERNEGDKVEQEVPLQAPIVPIGEYVSKEKIRYHFLLLAPVGIKIP